jgi:lipid A 3-O-deacylase
LRYLIELDPPLHRLGLACLLAASLATPALADPSLVSLGIGGTDILNQQARAAGDLRLEYRSGYSLLPFFENYFKIKPWAGIETTTRQSIWGGGGIVLEIPLGPHWVLTPNFGPGLYGQGNGKKLGSYVEFRSTFEGGYVFDDGSRLVASFGHTSNAGLTKKNPGTEQAMISYQVPLYRLNSFFSPQ